MTTTVNKFLMKKNELEDYKNKLVTLIKEYCLLGEEGKFAKALEDNPVSKYETSWNHSVRHMLYGYSSPFSGRLFYLAYGKKKDIERQLTIRDRLKFRGRPYYMKMREIYDNGGEVNIHVILDDLGKNDALSLESTLREAVREYGLSEHHNVTFPGNEQLSDAKRNFVDQYDGMTGITKINKNVYNSMAREFDIMRAIECRSLLASGSGLIADRIARQIFWTNIMEDEDMAAKERLRASELLGKSEGDFLEKIAVDVDVNIKNILDIISDRRERQDDAESSECEKDSSQS